MDLERLQLAELLERSSRPGIIRLHEQRVVLLSAAAMGLLRKELSDTFGTVEDRGHPHLRRLQPDVLPANRRRRRRTSA